MCIRYSTYAGGAGQTMGSQAGDTVIAIEKLTDAQITRIGNNDMIFSDAGKTLIVSTYTDRGSYATVALADLTDSNINSGTGTGQFGGTGIANDLRYTPASTRTIPLSLQDNENGNITVGISTLRANGHDFDKIGTGGFTTTN